MTCRDFTLKGVLLLSKYLLVAAIYFLRLCLVIELVNIDARWIISSILVFVFVFVFLLNWFVCEMLLGVVALAKKLSFILIFFYWFLYNFNHSCSGIRNSIFRDCKDSWKFSHVGRLLRFWAAFFVSIIIKYSGLLWVYNVMARILMEFKKYYLFGFILIMKVKIVRER